jgi:hypothetical protein
MTPLMLPAAPKDVGRLSDVLVSALSSVGGAFENRLILTKVNHSVVILVDGLGFENLRDSSGYARFLNSHLEQSIRCEFPSTTATSLTGLATGTRSGKHGIIGYSVFDRDLGEQKNLLTGWSSAVEASEFKNQRALSESSGELAMYVIGPEVYESSGFTELTMKGAKYLSAEKMSDRFAALERVFGSTKPSVTYLYIPELDQAAHKYGVSSNQWLFLLEELDLIVNRFISKLSGNVGVLLTADHGVIDVPQSEHVYLDEFDWYQSQVLNTTGDPRCNFVYLKDPAQLSAFIQDATESLGSMAYVCTREQLVQTGWLTQGVSKMSPEAYLIWKDSKVAYDRRFSKPHYLKMIGQHGGISDRETRIPLIKFGKY